MVTAFLFNFIFSSKFRDEAKKTLKRCHQRFVGFWLILAKNFGCRKSPTPENYVELSLLAAVDVASNVFSEAVGVGELRAVVAEPVVAGLGVGEHHEEAAEDVGGEEEEEDGGADAEDGAEEPPP